MLTGSCYGLHCMHWEMTLSRGILRGYKLSVEWMVLLIALHVLGDDTD